MSCEFVTPEMYGAGGGIDDTLAFAAMALDVADGARIVVPGKTYILGANVLFPQNSLQFDCGPGTVFKQKDATLSMDTMMTFSGDHVRVTGYGEWNGNLIGNSGTYTGRGELLRISGNYCHVEMQGNGTQDTGLASAIYVAGVHNRIYANTFNTGTNAVRCAGDYNRYFLNMYEFGQHGFSKDNAPGGNPSNYTYVNVGIASTTKSQILEAVLFDHDGVQGHTCFIDFGYLYAPNATGPDFIKFVYMKDVTLRGFRASHATVDSYRTSLRFQEGVERVTLDNCVFPGSVNFDPTVDCELIVVNGCAFGDAIEVNSGIEDFRGIASFGDGTRFQNCRASAITVGSASTGIDSQLNFGRCHFHGATDSTPNVARYAQSATSGTKRRMIAGAVTIRKPLSVTGTFKSLEVAGRWIGLSETQDAACSQAGDRVFLCGNSDFPMPRDTEAWKVGDVLKRRAPSLSTPPSPPFVYEAICTTAGSSTTTAWTASTAYAAGNWVSNGARIYACATAGTSAGSGGPSGTGTAIADGTAAWDYVDSKAVFNVGVTLSVSP